MGQRLGPHDFVSRQRPRRYQAHPNPDPKASCLLAFAWAVLGLVFLIGALGDVTARASADAATGSDPLSGPVVTLPATDTDH